MTHSGLVVMCRRVILPHPASVSMTVINTGFVASFMNHFTPLNSTCTIIHMYVYITSFFKTSCNLFYSSFIEIEFIYHIIHVFKVLNSVVLGTVTELYSHLILEHFHLIQEHFHSKRNPGPISRHSSILPSPSPGNH